MSDGPYSKGAVNRAGQHLATRLTAFRAGERALFVDPEDPDDAAARDVVAWWRSTHGAPMVRVAGVVRRHAPPLQVGEESLPVVTSRSKQFATIIAKLLREPGKLADMADIAGVRAVVDHQAAVDALAAVLVDELDVRRVRDRARNPQPSGYRGVHLHVRDDGRMVEVQVRSLAQDTWANLVEEESRLSGHDYKSSSGPPQVLDFFRAMADLWGLIELDEEHPGLADRLTRAYARAEPLLVSPRLRSLR